MTILKITTFVFLLSLFSLNPVQEQADTPTINKPCPNIKFNDIWYYKKKQASISDFKGSWLVLNCFNHSCGACIMDLPRVDSMQKRFSKSVKFLLVGYNGNMWHEIWPKGVTIDQIFKTSYKNVRSKAKLSLPIAYDSVLYKRFDFGGGTNVIVVDPNGIIRAMTTHLETGNLTALISGQDPKLPGILTRTKERERRMKKLENHE